MDRELFKKIDYYWILLILTITWCFGFFLTNNSMGINDEILHIHGSTEEILESNRLGNFLFYHLFQNNEYLPFWSEFISIILYALGITFHVENFMCYINPQFDKKLATIFSLVSISFPYLAFHFFFFENIMQHGFLMIMTALAVRFFYKFIEDKLKKTNMIFSFLCLFLATSVYESSVYYFVIACLFIEIYKLLTNQYKQRYFVLLLIFFYSFLSVIANVVASGIIQRCLGLKLSKLDWYLIYDFSSINNFIDSFLFSMQEFWQIVCVSIKYNVGTVISILLIVTFIVYSFAYSIKQKNINIIIYSLLIILIPFSNLIILGNPYMPFRSYATLSFFNAIVLSLLYISFKERKIISNIIICFICLVIIYQSQEMNQIFYTENLKVSNDKQFAYFIMHDLKRLGLEQKPIIFIGTKENPKLRHNYEESHEINLSTFNWDRYDSFAREIFIERSYGFFRELGLDIKSYRDLGIESDDEYEELYQDIKRKVKGMQIYPKDGSIKDVGDYVIIKIGKTKGDIK